MVPAHDVLAALLRPYGGTSPSGSTPPHMSLVTPYGRKPAMTHDARLDGRHFPSGPQPTTLEGRALAAAFLWRMTHVASPCLAA